MIRNHPEHGWQFQHPAGDWRTLTDPAGPPTARQLRTLNDAGRLTISEQPGPPITKLQASHTIDELK